MFPAEKYAGFINVFLDRIFTISTTPETFMQKRLLSLFLILGLLLGGCGTAGAGDPATTESFQEFTKDLFLSTVTSDSLTLNYTLSSPEQYGITTLPNGFPAFSKAEWKQNVSATENTLSRLREYDRNKLISKDQLLYDVLASSLETDIKAEPFLSYSYSFDPTSGIQAQLPVLLSEFLIHKRQDIDQYFALIQSLPDYFSSLLALEQSKDAAKTLPAKSTLKKTIAQCQNLLSASGTEPIHKNFQKKLAGLSFLSADEKNKLLEKHKQALQDDLIPAYQSLIEGLTKLLPRAPTDGALASYPNGRNYYAYLLWYKTGSSLTPKQLEKELTQMLTAAEQELFAIAAKAPAAFRSCETYGARYTDPAQTLRTLRQKITTDFPAISQPACHIRYVDASLEDFLSPAFYLTPPIDSKTVNVIYINGAARYKHSSLFNTLAHEAYPGHLYQNCYMRQKKMAPLRYVLDFPGYTEGYATYAEIYSYRYLGASKEETAILENNSISLHCLYALCDLGIHYFHWNQTQLAAFLQTHGVYADESIQSIYETIIDSPGSYLPYTVGYLEITKLKTAFQDEMKTSYSDLLFHQFLLDSGPAPYPVLHNYIKTWCKEKASQSP